MTISTRCPTLPIRGYVESDNGFPLSRARQAARLLPAGDAAFHLAQVILMNDTIDDIRDFFNQGGTLQALVDIDPARLDELYAYATQLFDAEDYAGAKRYYQLLTRLSHWQFDYWFALGLACQQLNEHAEAAFCFGKAGVLRLSDPRPAYLAGLSYQLMGHGDLADKAFAASIKWCSDKPEYADLKREVESNTSRSIQ
jgi:secretion system chaperone SscA